MTTPGRSLPVGGESRRTTIHPDSHLAAYERMLDWLKDNGAEFPHLIRPGGDSVDLGIRTTKKIGRVEPVMRIPMKCIITVELAKQTEYGKKIDKQVHPVNNPFIFLEAFLLHERRLSASFWKPFIDILIYPTVFKTCPLFFKDKQLELLKGSFTLEMMQQRKQRWKNTYDALCKVLPEFRVHSFDDFLWARIAVFSSAFEVVVHGKETTALVPYADTINASKERNCNWDYHDESDSFLLSTTKIIPYGGLIKIIYGKKCNSQLFVYYGLTLADNQEYNKAVVKLSLNPDGPEFAYKQDVFRLSDQRYKIGTFGADDSGEFLRMACVLVAKKDELISEISCPGKHKLKPIGGYTCDVCKTSPSNTCLHGCRICNFKVCFECYFKDFSDETTMKSMELIYEGVLDSLDQFTCSKEEDREFLASQRAQEEIDFKNSILMRLSEKEVLDSWLQHTRIVLGKPEESFGLRKLCRDLDLMDYLANFTREKVGIADLEDLSEDDLKVLIPAIGPRNRLKRHIQQNLGNTFESSRWTSSENKQEFPSMTEGQTCYYKDQKSVNKAAEHGDVIKKSQVWECTRCTLINEVGSKRCIVCDYVPQKIDTSIKKHSLQAEGEVSELDDTVQTNSCVP